MRYTLQLLCGTSKKMPKGETEYEQEPCVESLSAATVVW